MYVLSNNTLNLMCTFSVRTRSTFSIRTRSTSYGRFFNVHVPTGYVCYNHGHNSLAKCQKLRKNPFPTRADLDIKIDVWREF